MPEELREFRELVDYEGYRPGRGMPEPPDEETVTRCIQVLLARQCIYPHMRAVGPTYRILATPEYQGFFRKYFAAMGREFHHDTRTGLIALKASPESIKYERQANRLRKDETAVLLALRVAYEEAYRAKQMSETGAVEITTNDLYDRLDTIGGMTIDEGRMTEILTMLRRKGALQEGDLDPVERVKPLTILPGIEIMVPAKYIETVILKTEGMARPEDAMQRGSEGSDAADPDAGDDETDGEPA